MFKKDTENKIEEFSDVYITKSSFPNCYTHDHWRCERIYPDDLPSKVDVVGYVDPNVRIRQMLEAGIRIDAWNHAVYDFENPDDERIFDDKYSAARLKEDEFETMDEGRSSLELYRQEMYRQYINALEAQKGSSTPQETQTEAPQKRSQTDEVKAD